MNEAHIGGCIPCEWIEASIDDMFLAHADIREVLRVESDIDFVAHDLRESLWSRAENNQLACFFKGRKSFWPIDSIADLGFMTLVLFRGATNLVFVLSNNYEVSIKKFKSSSKDAE